MLQQVSRHDNLQQPGNGYPLETAGAFCFGMSRPVSGTSSAISNPTHLRSMSQRSPLVAFVTSLVNPKYIGRKRGICRMPQFIDCASQALKRHGWAVEWLGWMHTDLQ